jgi:hypothetical protein
MSKTAPPRRRYRRPTITVYQIDDLWRELGPAHAQYTPCKPPRQPRPKRSIPSNPLRIPPNWTEDD